MKYPKLYEIGRSTSMQNGFGGYNASAAIRDGEFSAMYNMGSSSYPYLSPRRVRGKNIWDLTGTTILGACAVSTSEGEYLAVMHTHVDTQDTLRVFDSDSGKVLYARGFDNFAGQKRTFVKMGEEIALFPDKLLLRITGNGCEVSPLENKTVVTATVPPDFGDCGYAMTDISQNNEDGGVYLAYDEDTWRGKEPPENPKNGELWLDTSNRGADPYGGGTGVVKCYSSAHKTYFDLYPTYVRLRYPGIGKGFSTGDRVRITVPELAGPLVSIAGERDVVLCGDDFIVVEGIIEYSEMSINSVNSFHIGITVERLVPDMDYVISSANRLWGCKSGTVDGKSVNEIYVSALGNPKNWNRFDGIASDSYAVTIGEAGDFTGAAVLSGTPVFFKERCAVKIYGSSPSNYETVTVVLDGVERGSSHSMATVDGVLFYKSHRGIFAYSGGFPKCISRNLGDTVYKNAAGGEINGRYYVSMEDADGNASLFVYDTETGLWHREDSSRAVCFVRSENSLFMVCEDEIRALEVPVSGEDSFEWSCETGMIGTSLPDGKFYSRLRIRADVPAGAYLDVGIETDSRGTFEICGRFTSTGVGRCEFPIIPIPSDHIRLRLSGRGTVKIYSVALDAD